MSHRDPFAQMWAEALARLSRADQMQRQFFQPRQPAAQPLWEPPVDILESADEIQVIVALPGVAPENLHVALRGSEIVVAATRPLAAGKADAVIRRLEIPHGRFERRIQVAAHLQLGQSRYTNGCLYITLHKLGA